MKNFASILADAGVTLTDEQKIAITKEVGENYKPIADWQRLKNKITELETKLSDKDKEYQAEDECVGVRLFSKPPTDAPEWVHRQHENFMKQSKTELLAFVDRIESTGIAVLDKSKVM